MRSMRVMRPRRELSEKSIGVLKIRRTEPQPSLGRTTRVPQVIRQGGRQAFGVVGPDGRMRGWPTRAVS